MSEKILDIKEERTGKTAAFALPMLDRLNAAKPRKPGAIRALILTPTRELALQIGESFAAYGKYQKLRATVIFGGVGQAPQVEAIKKGVEILIACPGRLNDLVGQGLVDLSNIEIFVLDEADRMLDMGFVHAAGRRHPAGSGVRQGGPGVQHRGPHRPEPVFCRKRQQEVPAALAHQEPEPAGGQRTGVQPHQARRG